MRRPAAIGIDLGSSERLILLSRLVRGPARPVCNAGFWEVNAGALEVGDTLSSSSGKLDGRTEAKCRMAAARVAQGRFDR